MVADLLTKKMDAAILAAFFVAMKYALVAPPRRAAKTSSVPKLATIASVLGAGVPSVLSPHADASGAVVACGTMALCKAASQTISLAAKTDVPWQLVLVVSCFVVSAMAFGAVGGDPL